MKFSPFLLMPPAILIASVVFSFAFLPAPLRAEPEAPSPLSSPATEIPDTKISQFFQQLVEGRVDAAYDELLKGTHIASVEKDVFLLKTKTKQALAAFGPVNGYEKVQTKAVGASLLRLTCISKGKDLPMRWRFYFYKSEGVWGLIDIRIDDRLVDLFEEPGLSSSTRM